MRASSSVDAHVGRAWAVTLLMGCSAACSSSSTVVTAPTSVRCPVELALSPGSMDAAGGGGQIAISVNPECTWEARSETEWITLGAPTSGQGEASLRYTASPNAVVAARRGTVIVNDQRVEIAQAAASCRFDLSATGGAVAAEGGSLGVTVTAQDTCAWTAVSQVEWVRIDAGRDGDGQGVVTMSVARNSGVARQGTVIIAGHRYAVSQAAAAGPSPTTPVPPPSECQFAVDPNAASFAASGGDGAVAVATSASTCAWTAVSSVSWITLAAGAGSGTAQLRYAVTANTGAARTGTITVARGTVTVTQAAASSPPPGPVCAFTVSPETEAFRESGGDGTVRVRASEPSCSWTAASSVSWITLAEGEGRGNGNLRYVVAPNAGAARAGTLTVARAVVTVTQAAAPSPSALVLRGRISDFGGRCPNVTFTVDRRLVRTNAATTFDDRCDRLRDRREVTVWGVVQGDGSVLAVRVRRDDDN